MLLKSDGASSSLSEPDGEFSIERFFRESGRPFHMQAPVPVEAFVAYGQAFRNRYVSALDTRLVVGINRDHSGYALCLDDGERVQAAKVVLAVGVAPFSYIPPPLDGLPADLVTHAVAYGPVAGLRGREVAVIGSGASAIDLAVALHEHGARVQILSRRRQIVFQHPPSDAPRSLLSRIRNPDCGIGSGWKLKFCADRPDLFHRLPEGKRIGMATRYLGPAPGWFMRDRVIGRIPILHEVTPESASHGNGRVHLHLRTADGSLRELPVDHVIAATGYRIDVDRFAFLCPGLLNGIRTSATAPAVSPEFETSVPGLHVIGPAAAMSFGPVMRFVFGADFTARRLSGHLASSFVRRIVPADRPSEAAIETTAPADRLQQSPTLGPV
jgi:thioredoxin reductase